MATQYLNVEQTIDLVKVAIPDSKNHYNTCLQNIFFVNISANMFKNLTFGIHVWTPCNLQERHHYPRKQ